MANAVFVIGTSFHVIHCDSLSGVAPKADESWAIRGPGFVPVTLRHEAFVTSVLGIKRAWQVFSSFVPFAETHPRETPRTDASRSPTRLVHRPQRPRQSLLVRLERRAYPAHSTRNKRKRNAVCLFFPFHDARSPLREAHTIPTSHRSAGSVVPPNPPSLSLPILFPSVPFPSPHLQTQDLEPPSTSPPTPSARSTTSTSPLERQACLSAAAAWVFTFWSWSVVDEEGVEWEGICRRRVKGALLATEERGKARALFV